MKREHLIIIGVAVFVATACGCAALGAIILWPDDTRPTGPPVLQDRLYPPPTGGSSEYFVAVLGTWQCTEGSPNIRAGSILTFVNSPDDENRLAYWAPDANSEPVIVFRYSLYLQDSFNAELNQVNTSAGQPPIKLKVLIDVFDENKMELYAFDEHRVSSQPAILRKVK